jgi:hypothetical protein
MHRLRIFFLLFPVLSFFSAQAFAQSKLSGLISSALDQPSTTEITSGIREALSQATGISADRLSLTDGYLKNPDVTILFPEEAKSVERMLRSVGLGSLCDQVITSVNRAAEDAAKEAKPIFTSAIRQMTLQDVQGILLGEKNAATLYFQTTTSDSLRVKFAPVIEASLEKVEATKYWNELMTRYNKLPMVKKVNPDLDAYVTQKAIEGLFVEIAKEELKIRDNLGARTSPLLQKVFGYAESKGK